MRDQANSGVVLIGLPHTGKTSFLAALWYMVGQATVDCAFALDRLDGDSEYLNKIRDAWLDYRPVSRNKAESETIAAMRLRDRATNRNVHLSFPDLSGESFRMQWTQRQMDTSYESHLRQATGGILFVHTETTIKPQQIATVQAALEAMGGPDLEQKSEPEPKKWDAEQAPTQVQLVDLLQFMVSRSHFHSPFRLAVVVSAWDRQPAGRKPSIWIETELPLLKQFLDSNDDVFEVAYYGVSAQGGRYALPHFWSDNFKDARLFADRLSLHTDPVSAWLWEKLEPESRSILELIKAGTNLVEAQRKRLARDMNKVMAASDIYDKTRFAAVVFRRETESMMRLGVLQKDDEKLYLSRLLLEDAYPTELSRQREHADEASKLENKLPSARVLIVGQDVKNKSDITEPIQWLIR